MQSENRKTQNNTTPKATSGSKTMAELLAKTQTKSPFTPVIKGQIVKGKITKLTPNEILIDINAKAEASVLEKDKHLQRLLLSTLKVGDIVSASILNPESDKGSPVVSLRRFLYDKLWETLTDAKQSQTQVSVRVETIGRGGFVVSSEGMDGFLPNSQLSYVENPQSLVGKMISVYVLELDRQDQKVIFSQKKTVTREEFGKMVEKMKIGSTVSASVANVTAFGLFVVVEVDGKPINGFIHISEVSWDKVANLEALYSVGQTIEASVIKIDTESRRIELSIKRLSEDPFAQLSQKYPIDHKVSATVKEVTSTGVVVTLAGEEGEKTVDGFVKKEKIPPTVTFEAGQEVKLIVSEIDTRHRRVILVPALVDKPIGYR